MSRGSIDRREIFIDITVPVEHSQAFLARLTADKQYSVDELHCHQAQDGYHIRITAQVIDQVKCLQFIKALAIELGMDGMTNKA
ncbi:MAG: hypothetical protein WCV71_00675 [Patescibacteria group bacterium]|jgi:hypothetical protein